jgi:hypothetical protein
VTCADDQRHERLLDCTHVTPTMVAVRMADGCSSTVCQDCDLALGIKRWPDVAERIAGPERGLTVLAMVRAVNKGRRS